MFRKILSNISRISSRYTRSAIFAFTVIHAKASCSATQNELNQTEIKNWIPNKSLISSIQLQVDISSGIINQMLLEFNDYTRYLDSTTKELIAQMKYELDDQRAQDQCVILRDKLQLIINNLNEIEMCLNAAVSVLETSLNSAFFTCDNTVENRIMNRIYSSGSYSLEEARKSIIECKELRNKLLTELYQKQRDLITEININEER